MRTAKRIFILLCCALLCLVLPGFPARAAEGVRYLVTAARANILPEPDLTETPVGEIPGGTYVYATEQREGFLYVRLQATGVEGWVHASLLSFADPSGASANGVKRIYIKTLPAKTVYTEDEEPFESAGLAVWASYSDGRKDGPVTGWRLYAPALDSVGEKTVSVVYRTAGGASFSATFPVTVVKVPLAGLRVKTPPAKTAYIEEQTAELAGLVLAASYTDGRPDREFTAEEILGDPDFTVADCHGEASGAPLTQGAHTLAFTYKYAEIRCELTLTARARELVSFTVASPPDRTTVYNKTEVPDLSGLTLRAAYDNGAEELLTAADCEIECDPAAFVLGPGNPVTLRYGGKSVTLTFRLAQEVPTGIRAVPPEILAFSLGEEPDLTQMKVYVVYSSGRREETQNYSVSEINTRQIGAQTVTVTSGDYSDVFTIYIQEFYRLGDVSGDGQITAYDARLALRAAVGYIHYTGRLLNAVDADRNGIVTAADARLILRAAVGLEYLS